jgi:hypothetical protein
MKKYLIYITLVSALVIGAISCEKDDFVPVGANDKPLPKNVRIFHLNPRTGAEYTEEELADLDYNPFEKESYLIDQPIEIVVIGSEKPEKIDVFSGGALLKTITDFTQTTSGEYESAMFTTTVTDLGLEEGKIAGLSFNASYDVGGGTALASLPFSAKYQGDISQKNSGFQYVGANEADTRFLGVDPIDDSELKSFESNRMGYSYDGVGQYATVADEGYLDFRYENDFSIGFWVRTTSDDSDPEMIADQDWSSSGNKGITIAFRGDEWRAVASDGTNKADERTDGDVDPHFNDGTWHYLAVTYDRDGDMTLYQDGVAMISADMSAVGNIKSGNPLRIAQDGTGNYGQFFEGDIADAKIYDYVLSASEIADLAKEPTFPLLLSKSSGESSILNVDLTGTVVTTFPNGFKGYEFNGIDQLGTIVDEGALDFRYENDFSISFWVNTTSEDSDPEMIADQDWSSSGNKGITIAFKGDEWRAVASDGGNKADEGTDSDVDPHFNDGAWHLLAVTYDRDGDMTLYQDGVAMLSGDMSAVGSIESGNPLRFAQDGPNTYGQYFQGKIANTIIYDYVLSASEVADLYN